MLAFFKTVFEILFGGYATPTKCVAFWRLALNRYIFIIKKALLFSILLARIMVKMARIVKDTIS